MKRALMLTMFGAIAALPFLAQPSAVRAGDDWDDYLDDLEDAREDYWDDVRDHQRRQRRLRKEYWEDYEDRLEDHFERQRRWRRPIPPPHGVYIRPQPRFGYPRPRFGFPGYYYGPSVYGRIGGFQFGYWR